MSWGRFLVENVALGLGIYAAALGALYLYNRRDDGPDGPSGPSFDDPFGDERPPGLPSPPA